MNGRQQLIQPDPVAHGQGILRQHLSRLLADDGDAQQAIFTWRGQHRDKPLGSAIGDGPIEIRQGKAGHLIGNAAPPRLGFV